MQGFELHYSRSDAIKTRTIVRDALTGIIEAGIRGRTEWNVTVVMANNELHSKDARSRWRHSHRRKNNL